MNKKVNFRDKEVIIIFADGFINDDKYISLFPDEIKRRVFLKSFMKAYLYMSQESCYLWSKDDCYALIYDPDKQVSKTKLYFDYYIGLIKGIKIVTLVGFKGYLEIIKDLVLKGSDWLDDLENYIHLDLIVVKPSRKGQGFGKRMIHNIIEEANQRKCNLTLETHNFSNREMYKHFGFVDYKVLEEEECTEFCMIKGFDK